MVYLAYGSQRVRVCSDGTTWQQGADRVARVGSWELQSQAQAQNRDTPGNDIRIWYSHLAPSDMLSPVRSHFQQHHQPGTKHSNLWFYGGHLSFKPPQFYLDRACLMSFNNLPLLSRTVLVQAILEIFTVFVAGNITFFYFYSGKSVSTFGNMWSISWKEWSCFKSVYQIPLMVLPFNPQSGGTIPTFHGFDHSGWYFPLGIYHAAYETSRATPPPRSLPLTLLCWQGSLFALSYYLVQDCVACVHYPSS